MFSLTFIKLTAFKKYPLHTVSQRLEISCNGCFYFLARCLDYEALLDLPSGKPESWKGYTWYAREKWKSQFSLVTCEDCLEVCFVGLAVGRNYVWCLVICVIFMRFGQAGAKRCGGCLKVIDWGWRKPQKADSSHTEDRFSLCNTAIL